MASNPRKFSEKIALHNQKQKEETEAFEKVMRDVTSVVRTPCEERQKVHRDTNFGRIGHFHAPQNTSHMGKCLENRLPHSDMGHPFFSSGQNGLSHPCHGINDSGSINYLTPPADTPWRRTHSDSALNAQVDSSPPSIPVPQRRIFYDDSSGYGSGNLPSLLSSSLNSTGSEIRTKSYFDVPGSFNCPLIREVSPNGSSLQIPIGNNTGSLPDLTNIHQLSSPIPIMVERSETRSPYSTSPRLSPSPGVSPRRLSPYPSPHSPGTSPSRGSSPGPVSRRRHNQYVPDLIFSGSRNHLDHSSPQSHQSPNRLRVPTYSSSSRHDSKVMNENPHQMAGSVPFAFPTRIEDHDCTDQSVVPHKSPPEYRHHPLYASPSQSPTTNQPTSNQQHSTALLPQRRITHPYTGNQYNWYSNTLSIPNAKNYRSGSPGDNSAPPSPLSQSLSPASSPGMGASPSSPFSDNGQQGAGSNGSNSDSGIGNKNLNPIYTDSLQLHFENINMNELQSSSNVGMCFNSLQVHGQTGNSLGLGLDIGLDANLGFSSFGQCIDQQVNRFAMNTAPQTPQTPSSIPDINVQDCSVDDFTSVIQNDNGFNPDLNTEIDNLESLLNDTESSDLSVIAASVSGYFELSSSLPQV
ncbi:CREB-regulated transcription coactivator 1-like isoform X2 [Artemia franciscana]|uniref:CREB-regulated transcription coactivator 1-like isoform X2 n=1 Tax=Artemia franciscana TaxID=6661 RepID=UPI0032D9E627